MVCVLACSTGLFSVNCNLYYLLIVCDTGRFGVKCNEKCHCKNVKENCQMTKGHCKTGCAQHFTGDTCQGKTLHILIQPNLEHAFNWQHM